MSASPRRVIALTAVTVALAAAVGITGDRAAPPARPLLVPGLRFDDVERLVVEVGDRELDLNLEPRPGADTPSGAPVPDEAAVRDLISALASARFDRVVGSAPAAANLERPRARVRVWRAGGVIAAIVGAPSPASGQAWVAVDRRVGLVPAWVADALVRDPDSLRRRRPFPPARELARLSVTAGDLRLELAGGRRGLGAAAVRVDPVRRERLLARIAALTIELPRQRMDLVARAEATIVVPADDGGFVHVGGPCPGRPDAQAVSASVGDGCVATADLDEVLAAARALTGDDAIAAAPLEALDRATIDHLELAGRPPLALAPDGAGWLLAFAGRSCRVDAALAPTVVAALTAAATPVAADAAPPRAPERWVVHRRDGDEEVLAVERTPARVSIRRGEEPVRLVLDPRAAAAVRLIGPALCDRTLLALDPVAITAIEARGAAAAALERGALVDEWFVRAPAGAAAAPAAVASLRERLASLRAAGRLAATDLGAIRRTLRITVEPFAGQPAIVHELAIGRARPGGVDGCAVQVDDLDVARLAAADCAALLAPLVIR
jgi:hypothetical protein